MKMIHRRSIQQQNTKDEYWLVPDNDAIRPYGILRLRREMSLFYEVFSNPKWLEKTM